MLTCGTSNVFKAPTRDGDLSTRLLRGSEKREERGKKVRPQLLLVADPIKESARAQLE